MTIPRHTWKIILVLEADNLTVTESTPAIAVWIPNDDSVDNTNWQDYLVSVDKIEQETGFDFFSVLATPLQRAIESQVY